MRTTQPSCRLVIDAPAQIFVSVTSSCRRMISRASPLSWPARTVKTLANQRASRFRTIQVYPKDLGMLQRQPRRAVSCPSGFRAAHASRETPRIHHAARRRGGRYCCALRATCRRERVHALFTTVTHCSQMIVV